MYHGDYLAKDKLIHGAYYKGYCRNANVARWNEDTNRFIYRRVKFGFKFLEEISYVDDDPIYDVFFPIEQLDVNEIADPIEFRE